MDTQLRCASLFPLGCPILVNVLRERRLKFHVLSRSVADMVMGTRVVVEAIGAKMGGMVNEIVVVVMAIAVVRAAAMGMRAMTTPMKMKETRRNLDWSVIRLFRGGAREFARSFQRVI